MKTVSLILPITVVLTAVSSAATTLTLNGTNFGARVTQGVNNTDYTVGTTITSPAFSLGSANLGDNGSNRDFIQVWAFDVTASFAADVASSNGATLSFTTGNASGLSGDPTLNGATTIYLLNYKDATGTALTSAQAVAALGTASPTNLGSFTYIGSDQAVSIPVGNAALSGVAAGERLYFALDNGISNNSTGVGDYFKPGATPTNDNALAGITLTTVPEPSASLLAGLAALGLSVRRRR